MTFITNEIKPQFFSFSFALSEPLTFRVYQKFKSQARITRLPVLILTHTHAEKIDHLMNQKNNNFIYNLLKLTMAIKATIPGKLCRVNLLMMVFYFKLKPIFATTPDA
jgi:hypothetical protein